jgi:hypothetical protein
MEWLLAVGIPILAFVIYNLVKDKQEQKGHFAPKTIQETKEYKEIVDPHFKKGYENAIMFSPKFEDMWDNLKSGNPQMTDTTLLVAGNIGRMIYEQEHGVSADVLDFPERQQMIKETAQWMVACAKNPDVDENEQKHAIAKMCRNMGMEEWFEVEVSEYTRILQS